MSDDILPAAAPALVQPGLMMNMTINLGEQGRDMQFQSFLDRDSDQREIDELAEKMMRTGNRLRAITMLPILTRQREEVEYRHNDNRRRLALLDAGLKAAQQLRTEAIEKLAVQMNSRVSQDSADHAESGRRGEFKPTPQRYRDLTAKMDEIRNHGVREENEAEVQRSTLDNEIKDGARQLEKYDLLIAEQRALVES